MKREDIKINYIEYEDKDSKKLDTIFNDEVGFLECDSKEANKHIIYECSDRKDYENDHEDNDENNISDTELTKKVLNSIIVDLFKNVLTIEEKSMKLRGVKDLSMSEIHVIEAIGSGDGKMMSEVAEKLDVTMGTLTTSISKLEKKGYAIRERDLLDKRVVIAKLTRKGQLIEKIHNNFHEEMIEHLIIDLKLEEDKALLQALININNFFIKEYGGNDAY